MPRVVPSQVIDFIEIVFPPTKIGPQIPSNDSTRLAALLTIAEKIPEELLVLGPADYSRYIMALETIRHQLSLWHSRVDPPNLPQVQGQNAVLVIYDILKLCPDQTASPETADLIFINDDELRDSIRLDISAANRDLVNHEYKGATVLAGSAIEALLLWAIQDQEKQAIAAAKTTLVAAKTLSSSVSADPERWSLIELIEVATELALVDQNTAQQARLGKDFRNLIHPGRAARLGQVCDRATALSALAAVEHTVRDLRAYKCR
jgi:hypothetical protein